MLFQSFLLWCLRSRLPSRLLHFFPSRLLQFRAIFLFLYFVSFIVLYCYGTPFQWRRKQKTKKRERAEIKESDLINFRLNKDENIQCYAATYYYRIVNLVILGSSRFLRNRLLILSHQSVAVLFIQLTFRWCQINFRASLSFLVSFTLTLLHTQLHIINLT